MCVLSYVKNIRMERIFKLSRLLLLVLALKLISCQQENSASLPENTVRLTVMPTDGRPLNVKIGTIDPFSFADSVFVSKELTPVDTVVLINLSEPTLAYLDIDGQGHELYLAPGYDLKVSANHAEESPSITYTGTGAEVNNYLEQTSQLHEKLIKTDEGYAWELEEEAFTARLDSMKTTYRDFHRGYTDTVALPEKLRASLEMRNRLKLISLKKSYEMVHYSDQKDSTHLPENPAIESSNNTFFEVPLDTTLLSNDLLSYEYTLTLKAYLDLHVVWPLYDNIAAQENISSSEAQKALPVTADQVIRNSKYPYGIKEFFVARNILDFLADRGITPEVDTIFNNFRKEYSSSSFIAPIETKYEEWLTLAPGQKAPDFTGTTPNSKKLSLSDLKGKVVYVDVWATWCGPCLEEFPHSQKLQQQFEGNDQVAFLYVSVDRDEEKWRKMVDEQKLEGIHIIDPLEGSDTSVWEAYLLSGIPRYILIDQEGKIADAEADRPSSGKLESEIQALLNNEKAMSAKTY